MPLQVESINCHTLSLAPLYIFAMRGSDRGLHIFFAPLLSFVFLLGKLQRKDRFENIVSLP